MRQPETPGRGKPVLKVLTYNVNYGLGGDPGIIALIRKLNADIVLLQETTPDWRWYMDRDLADLYPYRAFRHCCGAGGLAILSKYAFREVEYMRPTIGWFPAWLHEARTPWDRCGS